MWPHTADRTNRSGTFEQRCAYTQAHEVDLTDLSVLYVIILSAALDLVPAETPKGIIAFFNVFPSLMVKVGWPLLSNGTIRYGKRVAFCTTVSWLGIVVSRLP